MSNKRILQYANNRTYHIVLPKALIENMGLKAGTVMDCVLVGTELRLSPVSA